MISWIAIHVVFFVFRIKPGSISFTFMFGIQVLSYQWTRRFWYINSIIWHPLIYGYENNVFVISIINLHSVWNTSWIIVGSCDHVLWTWLFNVLSDCFLYFCFLYSNELTNHYVCSLFWFEVRWILNLTKELALEGSVFTLRLSSYSYIKSKLFLFYVIFRETTSNCCR